MLFNSIEFGVFFAVVLALYSVLQHRAQNRMLMLASYFFYGSWDWRYLGLIWASTAFDWYLALRIAEAEEPARRKRLVTLSLLANLCLLGFFKYFNFFADSLVTLCQLFHYQPTWTTLHIVLPVGISFYTFQSLSYTLDVYRRQMEPVKKLEDYAVYVAFFPQLVAGPIERAKTLMPQMLKPRTMTWEQSSRGMYLVLTGLMKKVAIADGLSPSVDAIFNSGKAPSKADAVLALWAFAFQIYCDFSGYSDVARGTAKILGFDLMTNFRVPYASQNPQELWTRWHISLSTWLRDYLYVPLGGNRRGSLLTYRNLLITMLLGGLWHGAAWHFVAWGGYWGALLALHRMYTRDRREVKSTGVVSLLKVVAFFQVTCLGWLLFRANTMQQVWDFLYAIFGSHKLGPITFVRPALATLAGLPLLLVLDAWQDCMQTPKMYRALPVPARAGLYAVLVLVFVMGLANVGASFIYFQF